jgi:dUTP pyrophosphatase
MAIPEGYYGRMASRSSIVVAHKCCIDAGVIDSDYRGHIHVLMYNRSSEAFSIAIGDRIAQLIIEKIGLPDVVESTNALPPTARGNSGFGSTGK